LVKQDQDLDQEGEKERDLEGENVVTDGTRSDSHASQFSEDDGEVAASAPLRALSSAAP
jgi:hypothetical protein